MGFNKKNILNLAFVLVLILFFIPSTRGMMQIFLTRIFSFSPSLVEESERQQLQDYNWKLHGVNTGSIDFSKAKGKVIVVSFWRSWKPSSIAQMNSLQDLYADYKDQVLFLFVTNETDEDIYAYTNAKKYTYPVYRSLSDFPVPLRDEPIPQTYIIDKRGVIVVDKNNAADWYSGKVRDLLDQLIAEQF